MLKYLILFLVVVIGCKSSETIYYKLKVIHINGKSEVRFVEYKNVGGKDKLALVNGCIIYDDHIKLICDVKKYTHKKIMIRYYNKHKK